MFPPPMRSSRSASAAAGFATRIVAEDCNCVPPPHQH